MRVLLIALQYDATVPGESWSTYKWVQGISERCETHVLTQHGAGWDPSLSPTKAVRTINWTEPKIPGLGGRLAWELKPMYALFYWRVRRWLKEALRNGEHFDVVHQINPLALRYPCPARGLGLRYIMGPLAGSLPTPEAFKATTPERQWYRKLRSLDAFRLRRDPWLRSSYSGAAAILGVAPYVEELLKPCGIQRFEIMAETGVETVATQPKQAPPPGEPLRLLFVGRLIRTKGILEAIESVAIAAKTSSITFDIVGTGDMVGECEQLITKLGVESVVRLHGRQPKDAVFRWYDQSHVFLFPSYREPSGNVIFEAMSRGLPIITSSFGGPGFVITKECGFRVTAPTKTEFVSGLAASITALASEPGLITSRSAGALRRISSLALWEAKIDRLMPIYKTNAQPNPVHKFALNV